MSTTEATKKHVMVTGATGYVAGWVVKELLESGHVVHAAVRDPEATAKLQYLNALAEKYSGEIRYFKSDLLQPGSYEEAMKDCEIVYHTASPFTIKVEDPQKDLIDPALLGTRNVLESVNKTAEVKRVVLTSSCVAIVGDAKDLQNLPNGTATEEHWNSTSTLHHQPYSYSKTVAEQEAWKIANAQERWKLVVINPSLVIGPGINPNGTSESFNIMRQLGGGDMKMGAPRLYFGLVDVRDLGVAHYRAGFMAEAEGRNIISGHHASLLQMASVLRTHFPDTPLPRRELPNWLVWLTAPAVGVTRKFMKQNLGHQWLVDNTKSKKKLGIEYRPLEESLTEFFAQVVE